MPCYSSEARVERPELEIGRLFEITAKGGKSAFGEEAKRAERANERTRLQKTKKRSVK